MKQLHYIFQLSLICLIFCLSYSTSFAQRGVDDKGKKKYSKVKEHFKKKDTEKGFKELDKFILEYPECIEAYIYKSSQKIKTESWEDVILVHEQILDIKPDYNDYRLWYTKAFANRKLNNFIEAIDDLEATLSKMEEGNKNRSKVETEIQQLLFLQNAKKNPVDFNPIKMDTSINTGNSEYLPAFNADGSQMIFTQRTLDQEDLIQVDYLKGEITNISSIESINTDGNEGAHALSPDGNYLIFTACDRKDSKGGCDLYLSAKKENKWTKPVNMGTKFNTRFWDGQPSISVDAQTIFFVSERPGGSGKKDIWYVTTNDSGKYDKAINMGDIINTRGNESSPFLHPDGKTLYFRSDTHPGMGDYDLFVSRMDDEGNWGAPINLGYPINSDKSEGALFVNLEGNTAYYASDQDTIAETPNLDIYTFDLPENVRPTPTTFLKATVSDAVSKSPIAAKMEIVNVKSGKQYNHYSDALDGEVLTALAVGQKYLINIEAPYYLMYSKHIDLEEVKTAVDPYILNVVLERIPLPDTTSTVAIESKAIVLENVFFESGSAVMQDISMTEINKLYELLKHNSELTIRITGHTDNVGSESENLKLSEQRAKSVYDVLAKKGIDKSRLNYEGMGESRPIEDNDSEEGKRKNRRTEFVIMTQ